MQVAFEKCAGCDIHKDLAVVCVSCGPPGSAPSKEVRSFGTTTAELLRLSDWLSECGVTHLAMESTGVYWKPVFNILEGSVQVWIVNAQHVKAVPGRKTDVKDAEWLAELMRHGLLRPSFVPPEDTRALRELTRYRRTLLQDKAREANRLQKILEEANLKVGSVASDVLGVSARDMLRAIVQGESDVTKLANLARGRLKAKKTELAEALDGRIRPHHRILLRESLDHIEHIEGSIGRINEEVEERLRPFEEQIRQLDEIAGVSRRTIEEVLAEIGTDMSRFPDEKHLASWAGMCPGNRESAGKRLSGRTRHGSPWLRSALVQAAWAAAATKKSYFRAFYLRLKGRRGPKRAIVAVAHALLVTIYFMLKRGTSYQDLGLDYFDRQNRSALAKRLVRRLNDLGYPVDLPDSEHEVA